MPRFSPFNRRATPFGTLALFLLVATPLAAQEEGTITGEVLDADTDEVLAGAQVEVEGTALGALSNNQGEFTIEAVPAGEVEVTARVLGYRAETESVVVEPGETVELTFRLGQTALDLEEVVVTGAAGEVERRTLGNTIASVDMEGIQDLPTQNLSEVLTGREPGVMGLPSGGISGEGARLRIRGSASLSQTNEPVVYVDGVRVDNSGGFGPGVGAGGGGTPSRLDDIDPESIERIDILKGAAAATLYGTEASNGVIQIFTKDGHAGDTRYTVGVTQGFSNYPLDRFDPHAGFARNQDDVARIQDRWGVSVEPFEVFEVDMIPELFGTGHTQEYSASVRGGSEAVTYYLSGRFQDEDGPYDLEPFITEPGFQVANDENQRRQVRGNVEIFPTDDLRVRASANYVEMRQEVPDNNNNIHGVLSSVILGQPRLAHEGNVFGMPAFSTTRENMLRRTWQETERFGGSGRAIYEPTASITLEGTVGVDVVNQQAFRVIPFGWNVDEVSSSSVAGARTKSDRNHREVTLETKGTWSTEFGTDWTSELVVGTQGFLNQTQVQVGSGQNFPGPGLDVVDAGAIESAGETFVEEAQLGVMAQNQIGWRDFAFATVGARMDEHSAFGETAGAEFYPKASVSVMPSALPRWEREDLSSLRLRAAVGTSGLQPGAFDQFTTFSALAASTGPGVAPQNLGNPDLEPERSMEWELGGELGLLRDRVSLEATYWNRTVEDALVDRQFAPSGGFRFTQLDNIGQLDAWGMEFGADATPYRSARLSVNLFANASFLREEIADMGGAPPLKVGGAYPRYRQFTMEEQPPGAFFGPKLDESHEYPIHTGDCEPMSQGELEDFFSQPRNPSEFEPLVQDCGTGDMLRHYLGKPVPDWQGAFGGDITMFGNVTLSTNLEFRARNFQIHDLGGTFRRADPVVGRNIRRSAEAEATLLDPATSTEERVETANEWVREMAGLSPYDGLNEVHDADWIRLREISLSYRFPSEWASRVGAENLSLTIGGRNLALWTRFPGTDPEQNYQSRGSVTGGVSENFGDGTDAWGVPLQRRVTLSVRAGF